MSTFKIEVIKDLFEAKKYWELLSPHRNLYDDWEFRYCFYKYFNYEIYFYVGYLDEQPIGLLPLQYNADSGYLEAFGGSYMRNIIVFIKPGFELYIPKFYKNITFPTSIIDLSSQDEFTAHFPLSDYQYILELQKLKHEKNYLDTCLKSKERTNIKRRIKLLETEHTLVVNHNCLDDVDQLISLNIQAFGKESSFYKPYRPEIFSELIGKNFGTELFSFYLDQKLVGVSLALFFKQVYNYINLGVEKQASSHLWTYITFYNIQQAFKKNAQIFDAGIGNFNWKEKWGLQKIPQYKFEQHV